MKKLLKLIGDKFSNTHFSKRLVFIVTSVWLIATVANYILNYYGMSIDSIGMTYAEITATFKVILMYYFGSKTVENLNKFKTPLGEILEEVASDLNNKS